MYRLFTPTPVTVWQRFLSGFMSLFVLHAIIGWNYTFQHFLFNFIGANLTYWVCSYLFGLIGMAVVKFYYGNPEVIETIYGKGKCKKHNFKNAYQLDLHLLIDNLGHYIDILLVSQIMLDIYRKYNAVPSRIDVLDDESKVSLVYGKYNTDGVKTFNHGIGMTLDFSKESVTYVAVETTNPIYSWVEGSFVMDELTKFMETAKVTRNVL